MTERSYGLTTAQDGSKMTIAKRLVTIDGGTALVVCPLHGPQPEAQAYEPGVALCGCLFVEHSHERLFAILQQIPTQKNVNSTVTPFP